MRIDMLPAAFSNVCTVGSGTGVLEMPKYEYKFVRLGEGWFYVKNEAEHDYKEEIARHASDGWRLVQIFAPGTGTSGSAKYYELVLEREV